MVCPTAEELAALYDGNLPRILAQSVRHHLTFCRRCSQEFKVLHQTLESLENAPAVPKALLEKSKIIPVGIVTQKSQKITKVHRYNRLPKTARK
jgi:hypothetical protein